MTKIKDHFLLQVRIQDQFAFEAGFTKIPKKNEVCNEVKIKSDTDSLFITEKFSKT